MLPTDDLPLVLVVDDDDVFRNRLCRALSERSWIAHAVSNGNDALKFARERSPDLVLVDLRMPGMGGLDLVQDLRAVDSSMKIIMLTGYGSIPTAISAMKRGCGSDSGRIRKSGIRNRRIGRAGERPVAGKSGVGAHAARARRLRRQHFPSRQASRHSSPLAAAQAGKIPSVSLIPIPPATICHATKVRTCCFMDEVR